MSCSIGPLIDQTGNYEAEQDQMKRTTGIGELHTVPSDIDRVCRLSLTFTRFRPFFPAKQIWSLTSTWSVELHQQ